MTTTSTTIGPSRRATRHVVCLYAVLVRDPRADAPHAEGVARYETPFGPFPWITDDAALAQQLLEQAREDYPGHEVYVATFERKEVR